MNKHSTLRVLALAGVCLAPLTAAAQDFDLNDLAPAATPAPGYTNEIDLGARYQSSTSPIYGRYNGYDSKGFSSLGGFHLQGGDAPDSGRTWFFEATGKNLDFSPSHKGPNNSLAPESEVDAKAGQQGHWTAHAYYDAITYDGQTFYSPYTSTGTLAPGLQPFGGLQVPGYNGATTGSPGNALGYYATHSLPLLKETAGTRRDIGGVGGKFNIGDWVVSAGFQHEHKEGTVLQTMAASSAGTAFSEPVNYDTNQYTVQGEYTTDRLQAVLRYDYSKFTDNNASFSAPFFTNSDLVGDLTQFTSIYSLPPSNDAHYVSGQVGYGLTDTTQVNADFRYGLESSNAAIPSITGAPVSQLGFGMVSGLNPSTTDQLARTYNGDISLTSRPLPKLDLKAKYSIDARQPGSNPVSLYGIGYFESYANSNYGNHYTIRNQSWTKQNASLEAGYRLLPSTKLTLGYTYDDVRRDAGDAVNGSAMGEPTGYWVGHSSENTVSAKITNSSIPNVNSSVAYEHGIRSGNYEFLDPATCNCEGAAPSGSFYQAPRTADRVRLRSDYTPNEQWTLGVNGKWEMNHYRYPDGTTGTDRDYNASIGPDISYSPVKSLSLHAFYTYEEIYYDNRGNGVPAAINGYGYDAKTTDSVHTAGLSVDWNVSDRLKIGSDYTFSYGDIGYDMYDGIYVTNPTANYQNVQNLPTVSSSMHSVKVRGEYMLAPNVILLAGYGFDMYKDNDWAYGWDPVVLQGGTVASLTSGESQNSYRVHTVYTAMRVKF